MIDKKQADRTDGTDLAPLVQEAMKRQIADAPTVANSGKPVGIKKARRNIKEQKIIEIEKVDEEKKLKEFMDTFISQADQTDGAHMLEQQKKKMRNWLPPPMPCCCLPT